MASTYELIVKAVDQTTGPLNRIEKNLKDLNQGAKRTTNILRVAGGALAAFATGSAVRGVIQQYTAFEKYRTVLATYLGTQEKANSALKALTALADDLPQNLDDVTRAYVLFRSRGIETTTKSLTAFSNIATANGKSLTQLGEAVADALTGEFERLKEFGIKVSRENDQFVADIGNGQKIVSKTSQDLIQQLQKLGEEGGKFGNAASENSTTLSQSFSNLQGAIFRTSVEIGEGLRPALKGVVEDITNLIKANQGLAKEIGVNLGSVVRGAADSVKFLAANFDILRNAVFTAIGAAVLNQAFLFFTTIRANAGAAGGALTLLGKGIRSLATGIPILGSIFKLMGRFGPVGAIITGTVAALTYFQDTLVNVGQTQASLGEVFGAVWDLIGEQVNRLTNYLGDAFLQTYTRVVKWWEGLGGEFGSIITFVGDIIKRGVNFYLNTFIAAYEAVVNNWRNLPKIFGQIFSSVLTVGMEFGERFGHQFKELWDYVSTLGQDPIENSFAGVGDKIQSEIDKISATVTPIDYEKIYATDRLGQILDLVEKQTGDLIITISKYLGPAYEAVRDKIEAKIIANRAELKAQEDVNKALQNGVMSQKEMDAALNEGNSTTEKTLTALEELRKKVNDTMALDASNRQLYESFKAAGAGAKELEEAARILGITLDKTKSAYDEFLEPLQKQAFAADIAANNYKELMKQYGNAAPGTRAFKILQAGLATLSEQGFAPATEKIKEYERSLEGIAVMAQDKFKTAADTLASDLARGLAQGKVSLNDFKSFFTNVLQDITQEIIRRRITQPLVDEIIGFVDGLGSVKGGSGGFSLGSLTGGGGGGGNFLTDLWNWGKGLFGFANGGIVRGPSIVGERGPELFVPNTTGSIVPREQLGGMGNSANITFQIQALDTKDAVQVLVENRDTITAIVSDSFNKQGRRGITS